MNKTEYEEMVRYFANLYGVEPEEETLAILSATYEIALKSYRQGWDHLPFDPFGLEGTKH